MAHKKATRLKKRRSYNKSRTKKKKKNNPKRFGSKSVYRGLLKGGRAWKIRKAERNAQHRRNLADWGTPPPRYTAAHQSHTTTPRYTTTRQSVDPIHYRRVEKLLRLAKSPNPHEAALARLRAEEIMKKYGFRIHV